MTYPPSSERPTLPPDEPLDDPSITLQLPPFSFMDEDRIQEVVEIFAMPDINALITTLSKVASKAAIDSRGAIRGIYNNSFETHHFTSEQSREDTFSVLEYFFGEP